VSIEGQALHHLSRGEISRDEFYRMAEMRDGFRNQCKDCMRARRRAWYARNRERSIAYAKSWQVAHPERVVESRRRLNALPERKRKLRDAYYRRAFGISADEYDELLARQGGKCAICGEKPERAASLHLDHDHVTGEVRAILCLSCNQGIGKFRDDPELLERAARYLRGDSASGSLAVVDSG
jgi:hypothetical protein